MKPCLLLLPAALLLCGCDKPAPVAQSLRLRVMPGGLYRGDLRLPSDEHAQEALITGLIESGEVERDVRLDFAANVRCEAMVETVITLLISGAGTSDGRFGFNLMGNSGDDFMLRVAHGHG